MGGRARRIVGLAFLWPLLTIAKTALDAFTNQAGTVGVGPLAFAFSLAVGLGGALAIAAPERARRALAWRGGLAPLGLGALSSVLLAAAELHLGPAAARWCLGLLAALACALTLCALTLGWAVAVRREGLDRGMAADLLVDACASLLLSFVIRLAYALVLGLPVGATLGLALRAAYPLLACLAWRWGSDQAADQEDPETPAAPEEGREGAGMLRLVGSVAAFVLLSCMLVGIRAGGTADYPIDVSGGRYLLALPFSAALVALALLARKRQGLWLLPWGATLLFVFAGAMLAMTAEGPLARIGVNAMIVGRLSLWALFWTLPAQLADPVRGTAAFYLLPQAVAYCLTDGLYQVVGAGAGAALDAASVALVVALMACALVVANAAGTLAPASDAPAPEQPAEPVVPVSAPAPDLTQIRSLACQRLAGEHGFTQRETVVLELVSQGRTVPQIAEEQGVSQNTVRTHTKGLYRKLDCHTKQDVMDVVARQMEDEAARA